MAVKIKYSYKKTTFIPPSMTEQYYFEIKKEPKDLYRERMKNLIKNEKEEYEKNHKLSIWLHNISLPLLIISLISLMFSGMHFSSFPEWMVISVITFILSGFIIIPLTLSEIANEYRSFRWYIYEKKKYYLELKNYIDDTENYLEYKNMPFHLWDWQR